MKRAGCLRVSRLLFCCPAVYAASAVVTVAPLRQRGCPVSGSVASGTVPVHGLFLPGFRGGIFGLFALQALRRWSRLVIFRTLSECLAAEWSANRKFV